MSTIPTVDEAALAAALHSALVSEMTPPDVDDDIKSEIEEKLKPMAAAIATGVTQVVWEPLLDIVADNMALIEDLEDHTKKSSVNAHSSGTGSGGTP